MGDQRFLRLLQVHGGQGRLTGKNITSIHAQKGAEMTRDNDFTNIRDWDNQHFLHPWEGMGNLGGMSHPC